MSNKQTILNALEQLKIALENDNWELAHQIDGEIKNQLELAIAQADSDSERLDLISLLQRVQVLYQLLISKSESSKAKIESELKKISQDKKVSNFYLKSSGYR